MPAYKAPLRDIRFLINEVWAYPKHYESLKNFQNVDVETTDMVLEGVADLAENMLSPLNLTGDQEGCHYENTEVRTPKGFKEAYDVFVQGGWQGLSYPEEFGGQAMPMSLNLIKSEMMGTANWSFTMYPGLSMGCMNTIMQYGTDEQKQTYMPRLVEGTWGGTMCLTESQCGTDLGQVRTSATPVGDGTYKISGTKIFISGGEQDLTENIIHIVLARLPDAPKGTRGISLFIVPKFIPTADGNIGARNTVTCGSIEHKMGIRASSTAVLNFDGAIGYMIGPENKGLECMFTFMNTARIGTALQGVCHAELSYQGALAYAKERLSMRALSGKKEPEKVADSIIYHADVRRMLLTQRAFAEGGRAMIYYAATLADKMMDSVMSKDQVAYEYWDDKLGFYTPILKGFLTELGLEAANLGMQVFGGHGYIKEWGMEQIARDARIATLYEGTTGVQALDLLGRKTLLTGKGKPVRDFTKEIALFAKDLLMTSGMRGMGAKLLKYSAQWNILTTRIMLTAAKDRDMVSSASNDFLMYSGYVSMAYFWAKMAKVAADKLKGSDLNANERAFYEAKVQTAEFYFERLLPRAKGHAKSMVSPSNVMMKFDLAHFSERD